MVEDYRVRYRTGRAELTGKRETLKNGRIRWNTKYVYRLSTSAGELLPEVWKQRALEEIEAAGELELLERIKEHCKGLAWLHKEAEIEEYAIECHCSRAYRAWDGFENDEEIIGCRRQNMEYVQMTLNDWMEMKEKLKRELQGVKQSFVRIGYALRQIEDQKLYERDGYKSIAEFAQAEYGLKPSTTSRFIGINKEYSVDGYSERLREEYMDLGRSQLEEMLKLPDSDRQMIRPETSREDIRELKRFNKAEPAAGVADDISQLIENFFRDNREILNAVFNEPDQENIKRLSEIINPGGNRSYRKGLFFLMMYENKISVKKYGTTPQEMSWEDFIHRTVDIFGDAAGPDTWENHFGEVTGMVESEKKDTTPETVPDTAPEEIAPAQKSPEILEEEPHEQEEEQAEKDAKSSEKETEIPENEEPEEEITENPQMAEENREPEEIAQAQKTAESLEEEAVPEDEKEEIEEPETDPEMEENRASEAVDGDTDITEVIEKPYGSRKQYIDSLTEAEAAVYISEEYQRYSLVERYLAYPSEVEKWLKAEVDDQGREHII